MRAAKTKEKIVSILLIRWSGDNSRMGLLDATERGQPILNLVWDLQNKVRSLQEEIGTYRKVERRAASGPFFFGLAVGLALGAAGVWLLALFAR